MWILALRVLALWLPKGYRLVPPLGWVKVGQHLGIHAYSLSTYLHQGPSASLKVKIGTLTLTN